MAGSLPVLGAAAAMLPLLLCAACSRAEEADDPAARAAMVDVIRRYGVTNEGVVAAMAEIPRHLFIPEDYRKLCQPYGNHPCPIGHGQTISQPYIVAYMTEKIDPRPGEKILEVGTGSGYQAAVLDRLGAEVWSIEIVPELAAHATAILADLGFRRTHVKAGDGYQGWPEEAPFDAIIVTCAPDDVPPALVEQLKDGGRMILPVGEQGFQRLVILRKTGGRVEQKADLPVAFVPMVHGED